MENFVQPGRCVTLAAPYDRSAGQGLLVGSIFGVASNDVVSGADVEVVTEGVFNLTKVGSQAWSVGVKVYWDDTNKYLTTTDSGNTLAGVAVAAVGSGAGATTGTVRLNGAFT